MKKTTKGDTAQFEAEVVCEEKKVVEIEAEMRHPEAGGLELKLEDEPTVKKGEWKSLSRPIASTIQPPTQLTFDKDKGSLLKATREDGGESSDPMGAD